MGLRIVVDLDGVICPIKAEGQAYADLHPLPGAADRIRELRSQGHVIVIQTARNMATCDGHLGRVMRNVGKVTLDWLEQHQIEYDELYFGKPNGHVYLDDRAVRFTDWNSATTAALEAAARER